MIRPANCGAPFARHAYSSMTETLAFLSLAAASRTSISTLSSISSNQATQLHGIRATVTWRERGV